MSELLKDKKERRKLIADSVPTIEAVCKMYKSSINITYSSNKKKWRVITLSKPFWDKDYLVALVNAIAFLHNTHEQNKDLLKNVEP